MYEPEWNKKMKAVFKKFVKHFYRSLFYPSFSTLYMRMMIVRSKAGAQHKTIITLSFLSIPTISSNNIIKHFRLTSNSKRKV